MISIHHQLLTPFLLFTLLFSTQAISANEDGNAFQAISYERVGNSWHIRGTSNSCGVLWLTQTPNDLSHYRITDVYNIDNPNACSSDNLYVGLIPHSEAAPLLDEFENDCPAFPENYISYVFDEEGNEKGVMLSGDEIKEIVQINNDMDMPVISTDEMMVLVISNSCDEDIIVNVEHTISFQLTITMVLLCAALVVSVTASIVLGWVIYREYITAKSTSIQFYVPLSTQSI